MPLLTEPYLTQNERWPQTGRHILAQFDDDSVVVYQAYRPSIGHFAAKNGYFGGSEFGLNRMSWIKPNFLWMMFRCGWSTKENQEVTVAIWLKRAAFDEILRQAVHSTFAPKVYDTHDEWQSAVSRSAVRLQWDPDHNPSGNPVERRAIQLGLRGKVLAQYAREWILHIEDISDFAHEQYAHVKNRHLNHLLTPREAVYPVIDAQTRIKLGLSTHP
ncbi:MAG: DUF4291 domain-containing protein [Chloroflexota bacterium]